MNQITENHDTSQPILTALRVARVRRWLKPPDGRRYFEDQLMFDVRLSREGETLTLTVDAATMLNFRKFQAFVLEGWGHVLEYRTPREWSAELAAAPLRNEVRP